MAESNITDPVLQAQLEAIKRQIEEERQKQIAEAQGQAVSRGLTGSTYQATKESLANKNALNQATDAAINFAVQQSTRQREDKLLKDQRDFQSGQDQLNRQFSSLESEKQRAWQMGENDKAQQIAMQQAELERSAAERAGNMNLIGQGIGAGAGLLGSLLAPKQQFGVGPGGGLSVTQTPGLLGKLFGGGTPGAGMGALKSVGGAGIGLLGGGYAGQSLAKLTGRNTREAKFGSALGAGVGTLMFGPLGGIAGGAIGGLGAKAIQGVGKKVKKIFCFAGNTPIFMADGTQRLISDLSLGDATAGGDVISIRMATTDDTLYAYRGIKVTGHHAVEENGAWKRVKDSLFSIPTSESSIVWSIATTDHRVYVPTVGFGYTMFADELETDMYEYLSIDESLAVLNDEVKTYG